VLFVRDTAAHVALEQAHQHPHADDAPPPLREAFAETTYRVPTLRSCAQAGLVNNLNDGLAWGLVPLFLAAHGASVGSIGLVAAVYPGVWSVAQITGHWSDSIGRKPLIVAGMLLQAAALTLLALSDGAVAIATTTAALLGLGTALVYPTLIAATSDAVAPVARTTVIGVHRFWRDSGYATADWQGLCLSEGLARSNSGHHDFRAPGHELTNTSHRQLENSSNYAGYRPWPWPRPGLDPGTPRFQGECSRRRPQWRR
jgi:hypothetical protein